VFPPGQITKEPLLLGKSKIHASRDSHGINPSLLVMFIKAILQVNMPHIDAERQELGIGLPLY
jgi:hypothetical protein